jgi:hypothetical protein
MSPSGEIFNEPKRSFQRIGRIPLRCGRLAVAGLPCPENPQGVGFRDRSGKNLVKKRKDSHQTDYPSDFPQETRF